MATRQWEEALASARSINAGVVAGWCREHLGLVAAEQGDPRYIVDLIGKVTRVAVETVRIVGDLATG